MNHNLKNTPQKNLNRRDSLQAMQKEFQNYWATLYVIIRADAKRRNLGRLFWNIYLLDYMSRAADIVSLKIGNFVSDM